MSERFDVVVVGGGQAGLATSHELAAHGIEHVVLERGRIGETWHGRWDSFCLVTPNWSIRLPGLPYDGDDPDGFLPRDQIVTYLERYADGFAAPVREGVHVGSLEVASDGGFELATSEGAIHARTVVVCTGAYQRPHRPPGAETLPQDLPQIDLEGYRSPTGVPPGRVLVVGSGQSGCQLAEELLEDGREVVLACGRAPWAPRRIGGRDVVWWLVESGFMDAPASTLESPAARLVSNPQATGHGGGHDLHYRTLQKAGVTLAGRFLGADDGRLRFAPDLSESVAWGDERYAQLIGLFRKLCGDRGMSVPEMAEPEPFDGSAPLELDRAGFGAVIFTSGYRPDYGWVRVPGAFDGTGFPVQQDGASLVAPGLSFVGVHFLRTRQSGILHGVGQDASIVAADIARRRSSSIER